MLVWLSSLVLVAYNGILELILCRGKSLWVLGSREAPGQFFVWLKGVEGVLLGKLGVAWLSTMIVELVLVTEVTEFSSWTDGNKVLVAQRHSIIGPAGLWRWRSLGWWLERSHCKSRGARREGMEKLCRWVEKGCDFLQTPSQQTKQSFVLTPAHWWFPVICCRWLYLGFNR